MGQAASHFNLKEQYSEVLMTTPTASAFTKYITNPVGKYTGIPIISIPLYEVSLKDFSLPIALHYHAGGVKIEDVASNVGLGWTLVAGGLITRAVKDIPDDKYIHVLEAYPQGTSLPIIAGSFNKLQGRLSAFAIPSNTNFDGLTSYDIDVNRYNGIYGQNNSSLKFIKKFYGVSSFPDRKHIYLMPMIDKEPDIFYFNFAGRTGKFVIDVDNGTPQIRLIPYQDLKIEYTANPHIIEFRVTDEMGVTYIFSKIEQSTIFTTANITPIDYGIDMASGLTHEIKSYEPPTGSKTFISSWFLSRIETPTGQFLNLIYEDEEYTISNRGPQQTGLCFIKPIPGAASYDPNDINSYGYHNTFIRNDTWVEGKRLSRIENEEIQIDFNATHQREDLAYHERTITVGSLINVLSKPSYAIDEILIYNKIGLFRRVKKYNFNYDYFLSPLEPIGLVGNSVDKHRLNPTISQEEKYFKRLRLRSMNESGPVDTSNPLTYLFEYKYSDFTGNTAHILPNRVSFQRDLWGYYNAAVGNKTLIPALFVYPNNYSIPDSRRFRVYKKTNFTGPEYYLPGANRLPNATTMDIGILTKIIYPTQGYTNFQYEPHQFIDENEQFIGGGVRVSEIIKSTNPISENNITYKYSYKKSNGLSSGSIISIPIFATRNTNLTFLPIEARGDTELAFKILTSRYSLPQATVGMTNSSYVGYERVEEETVGNGKIISEYSLPASWNRENDLSNIDYTEGKCNPDLESFCDGFYKVTPVVDMFISENASFLNADMYDLTQNPAQPNTFPFPENANYDWQRGHLLQETFIDELGFKRKTITYSYKNYFPENKSRPLNVYGYKIGHHYPLRSDILSHPPAYIFRVAKYNILTDVAKKLSFKTEITYNTDNIGTVENRTEYRNSSPNHCQITFLGVKESTGKNVDIYFEYPFDFSNNEFGSTLLKSKHIYEKVLRKIIKVNGTVTSKIESFYVSKNEIPTLKNLKEYSNGINESFDWSYDYDASGNPVEVVRVVERSAGGAIVSTDSYVSYIWGYNHTLPIAKIENADYSQISTALGGSVTLGSVDGLTLSSQQISSLRSTLPNALITTYTYDPLFGITSETGPENLKTTYEYDAFGRLKVLKDHNGDILKRYTYQYKVK
jgi:YD repeat-containing protein